jgi:LmbE family N-acetylglucosaminyl deacetylase
MPETFWDKGGYMNILVIAAHMDDETFGMAGTIAKYTASGDSVHVLILTDSCSAQYPGNSDILVRKRNECLAANKILGSAVEFLDFPDMRLDTVPHIELNNAISKAVERINPETVYTHWRGDLNKDHRIAHESTMVACRPISGVKKILCYEVPSSTELGDGFWPNYYVDIMDFFNKKMDAIIKYKTELRGYPHPRSIESIYSLINKRGSEILTKCAEAFVLIRGIA